MSYEYKGKRTENDISGNGVTIDYDMLRETLRVAFNKAKWDLVREISEMNWDMKVIGTHSDRVSQMAQSFDKLCKSLAVVSSIDAESSERADNIKWANLPHQESCPDCGSMDIFQMRDGSMQCNSKNYAIPADAVCNLNWELDVGDDE